MDKLILFIKEGEIHTQKIKKALNKLPKTIRNIEEYEETLDSLAFRFSRLQGLLGEKVFKEYLNFTLRDTEGKDFLEILQLLKEEKKTIIIATHDPLFFDLEMVDRYIDVKNGEVFG